jgi:PilZ domain
MTDERRRYPRGEVGAVLECDLRRRVRVSLHDISATGALLASGEPLPVGASGRLQLRLGDQPVDARVVVVREEAGRPGPCRVGVTLGPLPRAQQEVLDRFLRRAQD